MVRVLHASTAASSHHAAHAAAHQQRAAAHACVHHRDATGQVPAKRGSRPQRAVAGGGMSSSASTLARGPDIIDLDHYMRSSVRPPDPRRARERLVVDAGGVGRVPVGGVGGVGDVGDVGDVGGSDGERHKRYWHDSGLSDSSYAERIRQKPHRRCGEALGRRSARTRAAASHSSVREFRAACERALRDQQQQLARMAELCQLLLQAQPATHPHQSPPADSKTPCVQNVDEHVESAPTGQNNHSIEVQTKRNFGQNVSPSVRRRSAASDSSDVTSSSSGDERRKDRHRTESCKTYTIIMSKLDELGRLLAARRALAPSPAPTAPAPAPTAPAPTAPAPTSPVPAPPASKRDQLVATEDPATTIQVMHVRRGAERAPRSWRSGGDADSFGWWSGSSELNDAHPYDVNNPLHLYAQAKRLQALHAAKRRAAAASSTPDKLGDRSHDKLGDRSHDKLGDRSGGSLCALCRGYWRALRRCVTQQLFGACS